MSFGFGVGDFLGACQMVWAVYSAYAEAPEQFRKFSHEISALHVVVGKLEDQLRSQGFGDDTFTLSAKDTSDLKILHDGLKSIMGELDALLKKYQSLLKDPSISFDRLKWGQEDLVGLRDKLRLHLALLSAFNLSLAKYVYFCSHDLHSRSKA